MTEEEVYFERTLCNFCHEVERPKDPHITCQWKLAAQERNDD